MTRLAIGPDGMTIGTAAIAGRPAGTAGWTKAFQADLVVSLGAALALTGLAELFLQRVVYRVGVHIPREGAFLEAYRFATFAGDFAFRLAAALLLLTTAAAVVWLVSRRTTLVAGLFLALLGLVNLLAWPLASSLGLALAPLVFVFAAAWLVGRAARSGASVALVLAVAAAALALALAQYRAGMTALGAEPGGIATLQLISEASLLAAAVLVAVAAGARVRARWPAAVSALLTLILLAGYAREPATVAIVSLWAVGVTMSLPGVLYVAAFGALAFAAVSWASRGETRHLAVGVVLLFVAGLQPQALHHGITAFLGLVLLSVVGGGQGAVETRAEVLHAD